jgi:hypothetical protein
MEKAELASLKNSISQLNLLIEEIKLLQFSVKKPTWLDLKAASIYTTISVPHLRRLIHQMKIKSYRGNPNGTKAKIILNRKDLDKYIVFGHCSRLTPSQSKILEEKGLNYD